MGPPYVAPPPLLSAHGDSFVGVLSRLKPGVVDIGWYSGASAKGLANPNSSKRVGPKLLHHIDFTRPDSLLLCFGQVDINMNFLYQLRSHSLQEAVHPEPYLAAVIDRYLTFINDSILPRTISSSSSTNDKQQNNTAQNPTSLNRPGRPPLAPYINTLLLSTALLPVVPDDYLSRFVYKYCTKKDGPPLPPEVTRLEEVLDIAGIESRRKMIIAFNNAITDFATKCRGKGYNVAIVDINKHLVDPKDPYTILPQYLSQDPTNVHVLWENTIQFWVQELAAVGVTTSHIREDLEESANQYRQLKIERMKQAEVIRKKEDLERSQLSHPQRSQSSYPQRSQPSYPQRSQIPRGPPPNGRNNNNNK